jgi:hypothetical protein
VPTEACRGKGPEGEFLRGAGIDKHWVTSSGYMSCLSASGKWLGHAPSTKVLEEFQKLPESERRPGTVVVPDLDPSERVIPSPPEGGLVLRVHARFLSRADRGELRSARGEDFPLTRGDPAVMRSLQFLLSPNTEYMWLTREEWQALVPANPVAGARLPVPAAISERMARFHLVPRRALTSEDGILPRAAVKAATLTLVVEDVSPERIRLGLQGSIHTGSEFDVVKATTPNGPLDFGFATPLHGILHLGSTYDETKATTPNGPLAFGYEAPLHGVIEFDRKNERFTRFDLIALGDVWGRWGDANGKSMTIERPGRSPIGFAFELARDDSPTDRIPPAGNGSRALKNGYFDTGK